MSSSPTTAAVSQTTISSAITALLKHKASSSSEKLQLLPQDDYLYLNITLKTIPIETRTTPFLIPFAHPITDSTSELCLIIDDRPDTKTPPSDQIKKLIKSQNIQVSQVIRLSKLKANYKAFEAKRKLCDSYDLFLVDKAVVHLLPKLIGKEFFKKKKLPIGVDLGKRNLKGQVERVLGSGLLYLRSGTCCVMKVGRVGMEMDEIVENVKGAIKCVVGLVEREWEGVRSLFLKFSGSVALPIYQAMPDVKLKSEETEDGENKKVVKVSDSGIEGKEMNAKKIGKKKNKGRIHEVKYMDVDDVVDVALNSVEEVLVDVEINGSDKDLKVEKIVGKKRKVSKEKKVKKKAKVAKRGDDEPKGNDGIELVEKKRKKKSDEGVAMKSKKTDVLESEEVKLKKENKEGVAKKSKIIDGVEAGEIKPIKKGEEGVVKKSKKTDGGKIGETKPREKSEEGIVKKSKKTDERAFEEIKPKKNSEKGAAKKTDAIESGEKKGKRKSEIEKKLKGVAKFKDGKQKKRVSFE